MVLGLYDDGETWAEATILEAETDSAELHLLTSGAGDLGLVVAIQAHDPDPAAVEQIHRVFFSPDGFNWQELPTDDLLTGIERITVADTSVVVFGWMPSGPQTTVVFTAQ